MQDSIFRDCGLIHLGCCSVFLSLFQWPPVGPASLSLVALSWKAVVSCCCYYLSFLTIPYWFLGSPITPASNSLCNIPSVVKSQRGSSFPHLGSHQTLTKTSASEDSEKWIKNHVGHPWTANPSPGWEGRRGLDKRRLEMGGTRGWWPFSEATHLAAETPAFIL